MRLLIVGDDFGLSHGVTDGILEAHVDGIGARARLAAADRATEAPY
jgi:predicted glycoside hydrolase/deacetylase ChbG (UPF0249 family)